MAASGLAPLPQGGMLQPFALCVPSVSACQSLVSLTPLADPTPDVTMFCWMRSMSQSRGAAGFDGAFM